MADGNFQENQVATGAQDAAEFRRVLRRLQRRPEVLQSNLARVDKQLEDLCLKDYHVHIHNHKCMQSAKAEISNMLTTTHKLQELMSIMKESCVNGPSVNVAVSIAERHVLNQKTLAQHNRLLELLEVPQLMDTCVRKGQFQQAIKLLGFASTLERRHSRNRICGRNSYPKPQGSSHSSISRLSATVVETIIDDVRRSAVGLRNSLLKSLRQDVKLSECLVTLNHLKRIEQLLRRATFLQPDVLEALHLFDLKRDFLHHRDEWLSRSLHAVQAENPFRFLMTVIDKMRVLWFDIMTQYTAVFSVLRVPQAKSNTGDRSATSFVLSSSSATTATRDNEESLNVLAGWVGLRVRGLRELLQQCLPFIIDLEEVIRVMDQCMYFGTSLGRLGADFRSLVLPILESHIKDILTRQWKQALNLLKEDLRNMAAGVSPKIYIAEASIKAFKTDQFGHATERLVPPKWYLAFPALANFANAVLISLNQMRHTALLSLKLPLSLCFQCLILDGSAEISAQLPVNTKGFTTRDTKLPNHHWLFCMALLRHTLPFFKAGFLAVFGRAGGDAFNTVDSKEINQKKSATLLNIDNSLDVFRQCLLAASTNNKAVKATIDRLISLLPQDIKKSHDKGVEDDEEMKVQENLSHVAESLTENEPSQDSRRVEAAKSNADIAENVEVEMGT